MSNEPIPPEKPSTLLDITNVAATPAFTNANQRKNFELDSVFMLMGAVFKAFIFPTNLVRQYSTRRFHHPLGAEAQLTSCNANMPLSSG